MGDTTQDLQVQIQALRGQAQDMRLKTDKAQEYVDQQEARRTRLLADREQYVAQNPSSAPLVTPSVTVAPENAKEPAGCMMAGKSSPKQMPPAPVANAAAHPRLVSLNTQIADADNLVAVWKKRVAEYQAMADKLDADANTLEQRQSGADGGVQANPTQPAVQQGSYAAVLRRTDTQPVPVGETFDQPFTMDAIHIRDSNQQIRDNVIRDTILDLPYGQDKRLADAVHRDAIQLIPASQFAGGVLENLEISGNSIHSTGALQGIFGSDGIFRNLLILTNRIDTVSAHKITLNGLVGQKNRIEGNRDSSGKLLAVQLNPIRLGGNLGTGNVWIVSVVTSDQQQYGYGVIDTGSDGQSHIQDNRSVVQKRDAVNGDANLTDFPMSEYQQQLLRMDIAGLLRQYPAMGDAVDTWLEQVARLVPGTAGQTRVDNVKSAYQQHRDVPILSLQAHNADLQNFCIQALAKSLAGVPLQNV